MNIHEFIIMHKECIKINRWARNQRKSSYYIWLKTFSIIYKYTLDLIFIQFIIELITILGVDE
jgi:hypothetical protein